MFSVVRTDTVLAGPLMRRHAGKQVVFYKVHRSNQYAQRLPKKTIPCRHVFLQLELFGLLHGRCERDVHQDQEGLQPHALALAVRACQALTSICRLSGSCARPSHLNVRRNTGMFGAFRATGKEKLVGDMHVLSVGG